MTISDSGHSGWRPWTLEEGTKHEILDMELRLPNGDAIMALYNNPMCLVIHPDAKELARDAKMWCRPVARQTMLDCNGPDFRRPIDFFA